jgi:hypothetical protein
MPRTISSSVTGPVTLAFPTDNPLTITSTGTVTSTGAGNDGIDGSGGAWTVGNSGTVSSGNADGFNLSGGATLTNNAGGVITSTGTAGSGLFVGAALYIRGGTGNVTNNGSISGVGYGVGLAGGGSVTNTSSLTGGEDAIRISGGAGTISNTGTIAGTVDDAIGLFSGGSITNASGATISSAGTMGAAVYTTGGATNVTNSGNVTSANHGFLIEAGGTVTNNAGASISVVNTGVFFKVLPGTVLNSGNISGTGMSGTGVYLENSGNVTNTSTGTISGALFGAFLEGSGGSISNSGSISGASADGVVLGMGGTVTNLAGGNITGGSTGVYVKYRATGTVTNSGNIAGTTTSSTGVDLAGGGTLTNNATGTITGGTNGVFVGSSSTLATLSMIGTISNAGHIQGVSADGVDLLKGGSVTNLAGGTITGNSNGVYVNAGSSGTVINGGNIIATSTTGAGVDLGGGGSVTNNSGSSISGGSFGVFTTGASGTVTNNASIAGSHGVGLSAGGSVTNSSTGTITGQLAGVQALTSIASLVNTGLITATAGAGADIEGGGSVTNNAGGNITGSTFGVFMSGSANTVTNAGTITGPTYAVDFTGSGTNRLIVDPTAVFTGKVAANSTAANTLELASGTGSIGGLGGVGSSFANFQTLAVDAGGSWTLTGANTTTSVLDAGSLDLAGTLNNSATIAFQGSSSQLLVDNAATFGSNVGTPSYTGPQLQDFISGDKIDLKNISSAGVTLSYNATTGLLQITNGASQVATLDFQNSSLGSGFFDAMSDGGTGTLIALGPDIPPVIGGTLADQAITDHQTVNPFADVTVTDAESGVTITATINFNGANGSFTAASLAAAGFTGSNGSYSTVTAVSAATLQSDLRQLVFMPTEGEVPPGSTVTTNFTLALNDQHGGTPSNSTTSVVATAVTGGLSDVLWRNSNDDTLAEWTMSGSQITSDPQITFQGNVVAPGPAWSLAGIGEFAGGGTTDLLWRNANGTLAEWAMNGSQITSSQFVTFQGNPVDLSSSWSLAGIGDFNGNGTSDVLWRNTDGTLAEWTMNGSQITSSQFVTFQGNPVDLSSSWSLAGVGDFNGNGTSDVLWHNTDGTLAEWTMNGSQITSDPLVTFQGNVVDLASSWSLAGIGDFNGNGTSDVLWRNTNGTLAEWTMNGSQITSSQYVTFQGNPVTLDASWQIAQIGDFTGNGTSDILWRNSNGALAEWTMNGSQITSSQYVTFQGNPVSLANSWTTLAKPTDFIG